ncbi:MAG: hypothetical protein HYU28_02640 [Actinobacteria bacterium]|nr:hypothetical protein [Actinomycetota bacterium]
MKLRLPHFRTRFEPLPELGIIDPGPAFRILEPPTPDESVRLITPDRTAPPPPPPMEAGYRWGVAAAQGPCDLSDARSDAVATTPARAPAVEVVVEGAEVVPAWTGDHLPVPRFERAVLAVAARTEVLAGAIERLHDRLGEIDERFVDVVTHGDLVEIESRRARLAAEVSRLSVELKAEMDRRLSDLNRAVAEAGQRGAPVDHRGPLDLADARRVDLHLDLISEALSDLETRRTA